MFTNLDYNGNGFYHLGGDEIQNSLWNRHDIKDYMNKNNITSIPDLENLYFNKIYNILNSSAHNEEFRKKDSNIIDKFNPNADLTFSQRKKTKSKKIRGYQTINGKVYNQSDSLDQDGQISKNSNIKIFDNIKLNQPHFI